MFNLSRERSFEKDLTIILMCCSLVSVAELGRLQTELYLEGIRSLKFTQTNQAVNVHYDHTTGLDTVLSQKLE